MAYKAAFVIMAPDGDPERHRSVIKTSRMELTSVIIPFRDFDRAVTVCSDLVHKEGIQGIML
jgi:hypothetical protein